MGQDEFGSRRPPPSHFLVKPGLVEVISKICICFLIPYSCPDPESFVRGGVQLRQHFFFFLFDEGREDPNTTISGAIIGPPAKRHLMAFLWRADDGPLLNADLVAL